MNFRFAHPPDELSRLVDLHIVVVLVKTRLVLALIEVVHSGFSECVRLPLDIGCWCVHHAHKLPVDAAHRLAQLVCVD